MMIIGRKVTFGIFQVLQLGFILQISQVVNAGAKLEIKLLVFDNPSGNDFGNSCCDLLCFSSCDHRFTFSLDQPNGNRNDYQHGSYFSQVTSHFQDWNKNVFHADVGGMNNPIKVLFTSWPGTILFKLYVEDDDPDADDLVDYFAHDLTLTPQASESTAQWTEMVFRGHRSNKPTSLTFNVRLFCEDNYYGPQCTILCVAKDTDSEGHYTCDPYTGDKICRPGWENPGRLCRDKIDPCAKNECLNGATCVADGLKYTCKCKPGFGGTYCDTKLSQTCAPGLVGSACDVNICDYKRCLNGGSCSKGDCVCVGNYSGLNCEISKACNTNPCQFEGTCRQVEYRCDCLPGYWGKHCEIEPPPPSSNGTFEPLGADGPVSITSVFEASEARPLLIALIVIAFVLLVLLIAVAILLCRYRRRAVNAEKDCTLLSQGASMSVSSERSESVTNTYGRMTSFSSSVFSEPTTSVSEPVPAGSEMGHTESFYEGLGAAGGKDEPHQYASPKLGAKGGKEAPPIPLRKKVVDDDGRCVSKEWGDDC